MVRFAKLTQVEEEILKELALLAQRDKPIKKLPARVQQSKKRPIQSRILPQSPKSSENEKLSHVRYELFIPSEALEYESLSVNYDGAEAVSVEGKRNDTRVEQALRAPMLQGDYTLSITYDANKKGFSVSYQSDYQEDVEKARVDFTNRLDKWLDIMPKSWMGGVLGFTYLGSGKMTRRDDLFGSMAELVDVHEAIHTPDEYETRILTTWMLDRRPRKYQT